MRNDAKKWILTGLFTCALAISTVGVVGVTTANAEIVTNENVAMVDGAALRLEDSELGIDFGLRFKTEIDKTYYDGLTNAKVYTVLLPTDSVSDELTADSTGIVSVQNADEKKYVVGDNYRFNTVLTDIPTAAYGMDISVRSYVVSDNGTVYATNTVSRSVAYVADAALTLDAEKYAAVAKYCVSNLSVADTGLKLGATGNVNATLSYFDDVTVGVQAIIQDQFPLTYTSGNEDVVTVNANGVMTAKAAGEAEITVANEALGISKTITVTVTAPVYGELINFNSIDAASLSTYNASTENLSVVDYNGKQAIAFTLDHTEAEVGKDEYAGVRIATPAWKGHFDTISVTYYVAELTDTTSTYWLLGDTSNTGIAVGKGQTRTITKTVSYGNLNNNGLCFFVRLRQKNNVAKAVIYVTDITFGFNDIAVTSGSSVNVLDSLGYTAEELSNVTFTPTSGTASAVSDLTAFAPTESGTLTFTVSKAGYAPATFSANVVVS